MNRIMPTIVAALALVSLGAPAQAITCAQQAQICAKIARDRGQP